MPSLAPALEQYTASALQPHNCCAVLELCLGAGVGPLAELVLEWIRSRCGGGGCGGQRTKGKSGALLAQEAKGNARSCMTGERIM